MSGYLYFIRIDENVIKFGKTDNINRRIKEHNRKFKNNFNKVIEIKTILHCSHMKIVHELEKRLINILKQKYFQ